MRWDEELFMNMLLVASVISVFTTAIVQAVKSSVDIPKTFLPLIAIVVGIALGLLSFPFFEAPITIRIWAGLVSGLSGTGIFEAIKKRPGTTNPGEDGKE